MAWVKIGGAIIGKEGEEVPLLNDGSVHTVLDRWSSPITYDVTCHCFQWTAPEKMTNFVLPYLGFGEILDIGAGTGISGQLLIDRGFVVDGVDISANNLKRARERGYRKTICANIAQPSLAEAVAQKYETMISVGVFGDVVGPEWIPRSLDCLGERATVGICGRSSGLNGVVSDYLESAGFNIRVCKTLSAHLSTNHKAVNYDYVIGVR